MAMQRPNTHVEQETITHLKDETGEVLETFEYREERETINGRVIARKTAECRTLSTGELYHPGLSAGPHPVMMAAACPLCGTKPSIFPWRRRRTTRLCNAADLKACSECGMHICSRHRRRSSRDHRWRCLSCHRKHWVWANLLGPLFLREPEE